MTQVAASGSRGAPGTPRRAFAPLLLAGLLVLAGCAGGLGYQGQAGEDPAATPTAKPANDSAAAADTTAGSDTANGTAPGTVALSGDSDRIGWEDGYAHDAPVDVTVADGVNESEQRAVVARTTARVELIRGVEFREPVPVEVVSRADYRERGVTFVREGGDRFDDWRNTTWEAPLLVGEEADAGAAIDALFGSAVRGYYAPSEGRIVLVGEGETPTVDSRTLAHELVHALQDRRGWTVDERATLDGRLAADGLTEGDAVTVERAFAARCGDEWRCLPRADGPGGNVSAVVEYQGVYLTFRQPYVGGQRFVGTLREDGDWARVNDAYDRPPESTVETAYPERYPASPANVTVPDRSADGWERYRFGGATVGAAAIHAMLWTHGELDRPDDEIATDYRDTHTRNWTGDAVVPYTNGSHEGYVWRVRFSTAADARAFVEVYTRILTLRLGGTRVEGGAYVVPDGPFADAFRVRQDGRTVTIVNAPTPATLDDLHEEGTA